MNDDCNADGGYVDAADGECHLKRLAELAIAVGVNLQAGQELIITAPLEAAPLVRPLTATAYRRGASLVTCLYEDPDMLQARLEHAAEETLHRAPQWLSDGLVRALKDGAARLSILGPRPELLTRIAMERIVGVHASFSRAWAREARFVSQARVNSTTLPFATASWAASVFPGVTPDDAKRKLWKAIFDATRTNGSDPVGATMARVAALDAQRSALQARSFSALRLYDGRTDLTVGLLEGHLWAGAWAAAANGLLHLPTLPAEELFTAVRSGSANGTLFLSRPLVLAGIRVEEVRVEFKRGVVTSLHAAKGQRALEPLLAIDPGASRLGEIGLVQGSSPLANATSFHCPALDRHAASRVAFGQPSPGCLPPGRRGSQAANRSAMHIDCVIGTPRMHVDGIAATGAIEPVMRNGEFTIG